MTAPPSIWILGYGSLAWRPNFEYNRRVHGYIKGWRRVWWQGSTDHRGTPERPGRTVTLHQDADACTWGVAYELAGTLEQQRETLKYLEWREKQYDIRLHLDLYTPVHVASPVPQTVPQQGQQQESHGECWEQGGSLAGGAAGAASAASAASMSGVESSGECSEDVQPEFVCATASSTSDDSGSDSDAARIAGGVLGAAGVGTRPRGPEEAAGNVEVPPDDGRVVTCGVQLPDGVIVTRGAPLETRGEGRQNDGSSDVRCTQPASYGERGQREQDRTVPGSGFREAQGQAGERVLVAGCLVYVAGPDKSRNPNYLGPASLDDIARQIATSRGPSGANCDYLFGLADTMRQMGVDDAELFELAHKVRAILAGMPPQGSSDVLHAHAEGACKHAEMHMVRMQAEGALACSAAQQQQTCPAA